MCGSRHVVCLFGKKCKKPRQIPKTDLVIRMAYHMEGQRQPPPLTLLLYIKKASGSPGVQLLNEGHPVFSHLKMPEEIKRCGKNFICIHDHSLVSVLNTKILIRGYLL